MLPAFDWSVRFGDILVFIGGITVAVTFIYRRGAFDTEMKIAIKTLTEDFTEMKDNMKIFGQSLANYQGMEIKINLLMKWYDELRRGIGRVE